MKLLDRYILKRFFSTLFLMLSILTLLVILIHTTEHASHFRKHQLSFKQIFDYYCVLLPFMANFLAPILVFSTTIWVTTRLTQCSEVIAIFSSGISFHRLAAPYLCIGLILTGLSFYVTGWLLADANKARVAFETEYLDMGWFNKPTSLYLKVGDEQYLYMSTYHSYNNTGYKVYLDTIKNGTLVESIYICSKN
jgi:lipopolysaccharide export system permease protein